MTGEQWRDERMLEWLESGPSEVPTEPLEAAVAYAHAHPRRRLSADGLRRMAMSQMHLTEVKPPATHRSWAAIIAAAAVVVVVVVGGAALISRNNNDNQSGGVAAPVVSPTAPPTTQPTVPPAPTPSAAPAALVGDPACTVATLAGKYTERGAIDGVGAAARFGKIGFLAIDDAGMLYVTDGGNHVIRKVTPDGVVTTFVGKMGESGSADGKGSAARFTELGGISIDYDGNLYVADNYTIRKVTPDGTVTTLAGKPGEAGEIDGVGAAARFADPWATAVESGLGTYIVYVIEPSVGVIRKVTQAGEVTTLAGTPWTSGWQDGVGSNALFKHPFGLTVDNQARYGFGVPILYVIDVDPVSMQSVLRTVTITGEVATVNVDWTAAGQPGMTWVQDRVLDFEDPDAGAVDAGAVYVTSYPDSTVMKLRQKRAPGAAPDGPVALLAGNPTAGGSRDGPGDVATFDGPMGIVRDGSGTLYVVDAETTIRTIKCP